MLCKKRKIKLILLLIRGSLVRAQEGEQKKSDTKVSDFFVDTIGREVYPDVTK